MKIRHKLSLKYTGATAVIFSLFILIVYLFSEKNREKEFYRGLTSEGVTKANLFLGKKVDAHTMQLIYRNNRNFINEVEVAVYTPDFKLLYHDAQEIDIIKENQKLIEDTKNKKKLEFYQGKYQAISLLYRFENQDYIVTAAAYDGYGYAELRNLGILLIILWILGLGILSLLGFLLAKSALRPVSHSIREMEFITEAHLDKRLLVKTNRDEIDELSETFNEMLDRLEISFKNQKMFVSNVAHELRTPLAALIAEIEIALLKDERTSQEYKKILMRLWQDAKHLKHLITGLLDLAKAQYDFSQIATDDLRLDELLLDAREAVLKIHPDYSVHLVFNELPEEDQNLIIKGNSYLLKTAFINLIENNCKYSKNRTSTVHISFQNYKPVFSFSDTGIGIPSNELSKIFNPFYRATNSQSSKGHGIGLALAEKIILLHRGNIRVESILGKGTIFTVEFFE